MERYGEMKRDERWRDMEIWREMREIWRDMERYGEMERDERWREIWRDGER